MRPRYAKVQRWAFSALVTISIFLATYVSIIALFLEGKTFDTFLMYAVYSLPVLIPALAVWMVFEMMKNNAATGEDKE